MYTHRQGYRMHAGNATECRGHDLGPAGALESPKQAGLWGTLDAPICRPEVRLVLHRKIQKYSRTLHVGFMPRPKFMSISPSLQAQGPEDFREGTPPPRTWIHSDWYTDPMLRAPWSTEWEGWASLRLFEETVDRKLKIKKLFDNVFDVPGTVEPLAYLPGTGGEVFLFAAGGCYYLFSDGRLTFSSPQDFLAHVLQPGGGHMPDVNVPMRPGTNLNWCTEVLSALRVANRREGNPVTASYLGTNERRRLAREDTGGGSGNRGGRWRAWEAKVIHVVLRRAVGLLGGAGGYELGEKGHGDEQGHAKERAPEALLVREELPETLQELARFDYAPSPAAVVVTIGVAVMVLLLLILVVILPLAPNARPPDKINGRGTT
ncbi:hypothetical protein FB451DRAFT_1362738 [Mycena latifolia]|nr:hypothetical protein FB451DRAFT_1362738 [Mycena latifolia]